MGKMKKTPMGIDEFGNSVWVDTPTVTLPDKFTLNICGKSVEFSRAFEEEYAGAEYGFKSHGGKMWDAYILGEPGDFEGDRFFLGVDPDGSFNGEVALREYLDYDAEYMGKNSNQEAILTNFERYINDVYPRLCANAGVEMLLKSARKSKKEDTVSNKNRMRKSEVGWAIDKLEEALRVADREYKVFIDNEGTDWDENESRLYHKIDETIDQLIVDIDDYLEVLGKYSASTKKSRRDRLNKALNKLGGFTKEDDEDVEIEIDTEDEESEEVEDSEEDMIEKPETDKRCKSLRTDKRRKMRKEGVNLPEDADDQQEINQKGSGNAGSDLPEDADDQQELNDKGTGNAGSLLPEDADDVTEDKRTSSRKNMRKFSVTPGGSPNQESYIQRYNQTPRMREAIDRHFGTSPADTEAQMLQERLDKMAKSRRNSASNNVPRRLRKY